jgi:hypothetical protein
LEVAPAANINGAQGAFTGATNTLYLSQELLEKNNLTTLTQVFLEEYGHYLDDQLNQEDTPGDEGEYFATLAMGQVLTDDDALRLRLENDWATVMLGGEPTAIEKSSVDTRPPEVKSISLSTTSVNTSSSAQQITVTVRLTDDLAGVSSGQGVSTSQARFVSPSGGQSESVIFSSSRDLLSGSSLDGVYTDTLELPQFSESGEWKLDSFLLVDNVGNLRWLDQSEIDSLVLSSTFNVTGRVI